MSTFLERHEHIARLICRIKGHLGSRTKLYKEDDIYLYYSRGCCRCNIRHYEYKIRRNDPEGSQKVSALNLYGAGYVGPYPF